MPPWYNTVLIQMLEALNFLHSKNVMVVHRDVTPENILYNKTDDFVLAGFSLARFGVAKTAEHGGKFGYLAPEVYETSEETTAVDVWSLGILCLDMVSLFKPIEEMHRSIHKLAEWYDYLCELARHADKPEMEMMVVRQITKRSTAGEVLQFMRSNPNAQIGRYRPSKELVELISQGKRSSGPRHEAEIRELQTATY